MSQSQWKEVWEVFIAWRVTPYRTSVITCSDREDAILVRDAIKNSTHNPYPIHEIQVFINGDLMEDVSCSSG